MNKQLTLAWHRRGSFLMTGGCAFLATGNAALTDAYTRSVRSSSRSRLRVNGGKAALTDAEVRWALEKYFTENLDERMTQRAIAQELKVSQQTIARLVRGETWPRLSAQNLALIGHSIWD